MTGTTETKPEFRSLTEAAVLGALGDVDPANRIAAEVARLIEIYASFFGTDGGRDANIRAAILRFNPRWPIEAVAMRLAIDAFEESVRQDATADRPHR